MFFYHLYDAARVVFGGQRKIAPIPVKNPNMAHARIRKLLENDTPCFIGRFGAIELSIYCNYLGVIKERRSLFDYILGHTERWWWHPKLVTQFRMQSGFFSTNEASLKKFGALMSRDILEIDFLGSWLEDEHKVLANLNVVCDKCHLLDLEPFWSENPWTLSLKNKKVLIVHPFVQEMKEQLKNSHLLFQNKNILCFEDVQFLQAVQTAGGAETVFNDWFEALDTMKNEIDSVDYDVCLIGAGAYGFHLGAHVKRRGKKAIHLGGSLQLLFGLRGRRWEDPKYSDISGYNYLSLMNSHWKRPGEMTRPIRANEIEDNCYW